jgi:tetratricopeptide (TPR) repeat protein
MKRSIILAVLSLIAVTALADTVNDHLSLGFEYLKKAEYEKAEGEFLKVLSADSTLGFVRYNLGLALLAQGKVDEAVRAYEEAFDVDSTLLGEAANDIARLLVKMPNLGEAHYILGIFNLKRDLKYGAWWELERYVTLFPDGAFAERAEAALDTVGILPDREMRGAISIWEEYMKAVREGDREKAGGYWSEETRRRYRAFDWMLPADFEEAIDFARDNYWALADVQKHEDFVELSFVCSARKRTYCVIPRRERFVLANSVDIFSRGWRTRETKTLLCYYEKGRGPSPLQLKRLDEFCRKISSDLDVTLDRKIDYYKCDSGEKVGQLFGYGLSTGWAKIEHCAVAAVNWTSFHEIAHVFLGQLSRKKPSSFIMDGAASYFGGTSMATTEVQLSWTQSLVLYKQDLPIVDIIQEKGFWSAEDMNDPYAESSSFVGFLIAKYGIDKFKDLYGYRDRTEDFQAEIKRIYGENVTDLEHEWRDWLRRLVLPQIELGVPNTAKVVFQMQDPAYDDTGDGDYSYPLASKYKSGIFDLTEFVVREDQGRVYFELKYRTLTEWDHNSEWGYGGTFSSIAIERRGQESGRLGPYAQATVSGKVDCSIDVSDCGIVVWSDGRIVGLLKRNPYGKKLGDPETGIIAFSIPKDWIGKPAKTWRYAVAVGGRDDGSKHFRDIAGGFLKVGKVASDSTGGGGTDTRFNPNIYDILLPAAYNQARILGGYDVTTGKRVCVPMMGRSD